MNLWISSSTLHWNSCYPYPTTVYNKITSTSLSLCMKTLSTSLTNLMVLLPSSHNCSCCVSWRILAHPLLWLPKHTDLRACDFAHSPVLCHQPRFTNVTCTQSWPICGITPAIRSWPICGITPAILTTLLIDSRHHLPWVRSIPWRQPGVLVDGNWTNKMESIGRSKSRKLIKLVGPLLKGDMGGISRASPASKTSNSKLS